VVPVKEVRPDLDDELIAVGRAAELRPDVDDELLTLLTRVRPSLLELVSIWPEGQQKLLALFVGTAPSGAPHICARLCSGNHGDHQIEPARPRARSREELPVTFELGNGRTVVLSLAAVLAQCPGEPGYRDPSTLFHSRTPSRAMVPDRSRRRLAVARRA
jgi:hypothetical protein